MPVVPAMKRVRLETSARDYVATAIVPAFAQWPEILVWGSRAFHLVTVREAGFPITYREVTAVAVVNHDFNPDCSDLT